MTDQAQTAFTAAGLPLVEFDGPETTDGEMFGAQFANDAIEDNRWLLTERRKQTRANELLEGMSEAVYGDRMAYAAIAAPVAGADAPGQMNLGAQRKANIDAMFAEADRLRSIDPGRTANLPASLRELQFRAAQETDRDLIEERAEAQGRLANRSDPNLLGGLSSFAGAAVQGGTDIEGVLTLPFGAGAGTLGRTILIESIWGGLGAAAAIPAQQRQAARLGYEAPDPVTQVLTGAAFGAALPIAGRGVKLGVNALTPAGRIENRELLGLGPRIAKTPVQRGAVRALTRDVASEDIAPDPDTLDAAERGLLNDEPQMVRVEDVIPTAKTPVTTPKVPKDYPDTERRILDLIGGAEAPQGYDQVYSGIGSTDLPPRPLTTMTIDEVLAWQDQIDPSYQSEAAGRYQMMEDTLRDLKTRAGFTGSELFNEETQDALALHLMRERGLDDYLAGNLSPHDFGDNLAQEWAGLPLLTGDNAGRSYYAGDGLNGATVSAADFFGVLANGQTWTRRASAGGPRVRTGGGLRISTEDGANDIYAFDPNQLGIDAATYQFKAGGDDYGVTGRLTGERVWDPDAAIGIIVHERLNGSQWVVDGHQRSGLARRMMADGHEPIQLVGTLYREADGITVEMVRAQAAIKNIRQESGTPLDAARVLRDDPSLMAGLGGRSRPFMLQAQGLADLAPGPFQAVVNQVIPENFGAIVGRIIPDDDRLQAVAIAALKKSDPSNEAQAEAVIRDIRRLGLEQAADDAQMDLFGAGFDLRSTVITERSKIIDRVIKDARKDRALFTRLEQQADTITEAGNVLNRAENLTRAELAERTLAKLQILAEQPGPVRDAIDAAARALRAGTRIEDAAGTVFDALGDATGTGARRGAETGAGGSSLADQGDIPAPRLTDQPALGEARLEPGLLDDPLTDPTDTARVDAALRDLERRLQEEPTFDLFLPASSDADVPNPAGSVRSLLTDLKDEAAFITDVALTCIRKGA